jgi:transcriptional regulator with XRE-family HTH domain
MTEHALIAAPTLAERLRLIQGEMKWSQQDLADNAKCTRGAVGNWLKGESTKISERFALALEATTGYAAKWIQTGEPPPRVADRDAGKAEQHKHFREFIAALPPDIKDELLLKFYQALGRLPSE